MTELPSTPKKPVNSPLSLAQIAGLTGGNIDVAKLNDQYHQALATITSTNKPSVVKPGLSRMTALLEALQLSGQAYQVPVIHISGTNGKGSTVAMMSSILQAAGYNVGVTISPHLSMVGERITLNNQPISLEDWQLGCRAITKAIDDVQKTNGVEDKPTYFEGIVLLAFWFFAKKHHQDELDIAILETGMGGRLDATNVIEKPVITAITSIGMDHTEWLGETEVAIACEKAGIIKPDVPVIVGPSTTGEVLETITDIAKQHKAQVIQPKPIALGTLTLEGQQISVPLLGTVTLNSHGAYQRDNAAIALAMVEALNQKGWKISPEAVKKGLVDFTWPLRCQVLSQYRMVLDGSHNLAGWVALATSLQQLVALPESQINEFGLFLKVKQRKSLEGLDEVLAKLPVIALFLPVIDSETAEEYYSPEDLLATLPTLTSKLSVLPVVRPEENCLSQWQAWVNADENYWGLMTGSLEGVANSLHKANFTG